MRLRIRNVLCLIPLTFLLSGCFQQAGTALEPIDNSSLPNLPQDTPVLSTSPTPGIQSIPASPTPGVAITIISPTRPLPATSTPLPLDDTTPIGEAQAESTPTEAFVTPFSPLGPVTPSVPTLVPDSTQPVATPSGLITPTALGNPDAASTCTHTIQPGENLYRIALKYEVTLQALRDANPQVSGDLIQPGEVLNIPNCVPEGSSPAQAATSIPAVSTAAPTAEAPAGPAVGGTTYIVKTGDTLYTIAIRFGVTINDIVAANNLTNPNRLTIGQELIIPPPGG
jgi:LysM repeat protein